MAKNPSFAEAQHDYVKSRYYNLQLAFLKEKDIDLSSRGPAVQDAIWSTSVQFGPQTSLIYKALNGIKLSRTTDSDIVTAIQNYKITYNNQLFKSSSEAVRKRNLE